MGEEIQQEHFSKADFRQFSERLREETFLLRDQLEQGQFDCDQPRAGYELEAWLVDAQGMPVAKNAQLIDALKDEYIETELSQFNFELNGDSHPLKGDSLSRMEQGILASWQACERAAAEFGASPVMIGALPTVEQSHLCAANMSPQHRYKALNDQLLRQRRGKPFTIDIEGDHQLHTTHQDVMMESAATSFQIHWQVDPVDSVRLFNASVVACGPIVAACANSPFLFGKSLWAETRVPLFEQAVSVLQPDTDPDAYHLSRVTLGQGYARDSLWWLFSENRQHYPVLLPAALSDDPSRLEHLHLHNGTIWRWVRPIASRLDEQTGVLRIEQRVLPSGPTVPDCMANMAFYFGLIAGLAQRSQAASSLMDFPTAKQNFYQCAKQGLAADMLWLDGKTYGVRYLLMEQLLPLAETGLHHLGLAENDIKRYLGIVADRVEQGLTGATWQRQYLQHHQCDAVALTRAYMERSTTQAPVHTWGY